MLRNAHIFDFRFRQGAQRPLAGIHAQYNTIAHMSLSCGGSKKVLECSASPCRLLLQLNKNKAISDMSSACDMSAWDTRRAENLSRCFANCRRFNGNVSTWKTSNVARMAGI
jgi:surface protein